MDNMNMNGAPNMPMNMRPVGQLKTNRSLGKVILFTIITFGIYGLVFFSSVGEDLNAIASRYDGKRTMHFCLLAFVISPLTLGIGALVWYHKMSDRVGSELQRRGINYPFGAGTFWGWYVLGALILIGPFVYMAKICIAMNELCASYNVNG